MTPQEQAVNLLTTEYSLKMSVGPDEWIARTQDGYIAAHLYETSMTILITPVRGSSWRDFFTDNREVAYQDPDFYDKIDRYLTLRLHGTEEDYLRFKRQETVKGYFSNRKMRISYGVDPSSHPDTLYLA